MLLEPLIGVERVLLAFEFFRIGQFAAGCEHPVLRLEPRSIGPGRLRRGRGGRARTRSNAGDTLRRLRDLHAGDEPFQITLLFGVEVAGLVRGGRLEVGLAHSAGTCVGAVRGAGAAALGLWVM